MLIIWTKTGNKLNFIKQQQSTKLISPFKNSDTCGYDNSRTAFFFLSTC